MLVSREDELKPNTQSHKSLSLETEFRWKFKLDFPRVTYLFIFHF